MEQEQVVFEATRKVLRLAKLTGIHPSVRHRIVSGVDLGPGLWIQRRISGRSTGRTETISLDQALLEFSSLLTTLERVSPEQYVDLVKDLRSSTGEILVDAKDQLDKSLESLEEDFPQI